MNITKENIDELNAVVRINLTEEDYKKNVDSILKDYRKKANVPGFRPGMVPMGMIKKMYGKSVLAEEVNKKASNSLYSYIEENKLNVLGNPIPKEDEIDFDLDKSEFEFVYELGIAPAFEVKLSDKDKFDLLEIEASAELIEKNITDLRKRYGKVGETEITADGDMLQGTFRELDGKEIKEGGIYHTSTITLETIEDAKIKKALIGKKVGDKITVDPFKVSKDSADTAAMLNISKEEVENLTSKFEFELEKILRVEGAELNTELFDKLFTPGEVKTEEELTAKIKEGIAQQLEAEAKKKLKVDIINKVMEKTKMTFPDAFLKKWLLLTNKELTPEQVEKEYNGYVDGLKWQLIQNKIFKDNNIKVEHPEVMEYTKGLVKQQMMQYGMTDMPEEELTKSAESVLQKEEEGQKIYEMLYEIKMTEHLVNTVKVKNKKISYDDFLKLVSEKKS